MPEHPTARLSASVVGDRAGGRADRGVACILVAVFLFSVFNAILKWLSGDYGPTQLVFFRGLFGLLPVVLILAHDGGGPKRLVSARPGLQVLRAVSAFVANVLFVLSYRAMPLADAVAIGYAAPIFVTALSVPLLSERVGAHRWAAVVVGFLGVVLVARPGDGVWNPAALLAVGGTLSYAICIIATRQLRTYDRTVTTMFHSTGLYVLLGAVTLPFVWVTPSWPDLLLLTVMGCVAGGGMFFFVQAYRFAEATAVAPFDYTAMAWAMLFGFALWGEVPRWTSFAGIAIIILSGLYIVHREAVTARRRRG